MECGFAKGPRSSVNVLYDYSRMPKQRDLVCEAAGADGVAPKVGAAAALVDEEESSERGGPGGVQALVDTGAEGVTDPEQPPLAALSLQRGLGVDTNVPADSRKRRFLRHFGGHARGSCRSQALCLDPDRVDYYILIGADTPGSGGRP